MAYDTYADGNYHYYYYYYYLLCLIAYLIILELATINPLG